MSECLIYQLKSGQTMVMLPHISEVRFNYNTTIGRTLGQREASRYPTER